ncbi:MAG TPA: trypsin-like peptidase domain-containing protein [Oleiagrimonas sp.]|nr:trypsin-like peptidase domain-containing protein [Oleiagrimonas sp.]
MSRFARTLAFVARFAVIGLAAAFVISLFWPGTGQLLRARLGLTPPAPTASTTIAHAPPVTSTPSPPASSGPVSYAKAVARAAPSVVNIYANKLVTEQPTLSGPLGRIFGNIPTGPAYTRREQSLGSGVIVSPKGYVLTNNHVIAGAQDIQILLYDGRVARAQVVGADPDTDLAVLKLDVGDLPAIQIATSKPRVGDVVLAIGNPLGIGQTVTMGIVSAISRQLSSANPENFIQTDAAINVGNSGGALVNTQGRLVGINTALLGHASGAEGIGFAIPMDTAQRIMREIIQTGHVVRSWLGITYAKVPVRANSGLPAAARGVIVTGIYPGGPAAKAGIQRGDILLDINSKPIVGPAHLYRRVSVMKPGTAVKLAGIRSGNSFHVTLTLTARPPLRQPRTRR